MTDGQALETRKGPGAAESRGRFAEVFDAQTADWRRAHGAAARGVVRHGGLGFRLARGALSTLPGRSRRARGKSRSRARRRVSIVPGMRCSESARRARRHARRGDAAARRASPRSVDEHRQTAGLHARHAYQVGVAERRRRAGISHRADRRAVRDAVRAQRAGARPGHARRAPPARLRARARGVGQSSGVPLLHRLFQSRSLRLDKQLSAEGAASWMSGLLIGTDVGGALALFSEHAAGAPVYVIGAPALNESYAQRARASRTQVGLHRRRQRPHSPGSGYVYREQERQS